MVWLVRGRVWVVFDVDADVKFCWRAVLDVSKVWIIDHQYAAACTVVDPELLEEPELSLEPELPLEPCRFI